MDPEGRATQVKMIF